LDFIGNDMSKLWGLTLADLGYEKYTP